MQTKIITDKNTWDEFITSSYPTSFFQSWNWGEFQKSIGNEVLYLGFYNEKDLVGAGLGVIIRAKRGKYLYFRNGPVLNWKSKELVEFVIKELKNKAKELNLWHIRISPHINYSSEESKVLESYNFPISPMSDVDALDTWILDITQSEDEILAAMRKSTRYDIRKAEKLGVEIIESTNLEDIDHFYPIYQDTVKRQKWNGYSKEYIKKQFEIYLKDNSAKLYLAKHEGKYIAGSIFVYYGGSSYYHYSGSTTASKKIPAPSLIQWKNIQYAKSIGLKRYNFWGITPLNSTNHPWKGLSFFKQGFGGFEERWIPTRDIPVSLKYNFTKMIEIYDKTKKGY